jgi:hypothetical protein
VLRQLCTWQLINAERFREKAAIKDSEQLTWVPPPSPKLLPPASLSDFGQRIDPVGFDADGNTYYLLDDNRLYKRDSPPTPPPSKRSTQTSTPNNRRSKKRKRTRIVESSSPEPAPTPDEEDTWHLICASMADWLAFIAKLKKSRDGDEKALYRHLSENVLPTLEEEEKEREKARQAREAEYLREQAFLARKRSTRLVQKEESKKVQEEREAELVKLRAEEDERKREEARLKKLEQEREARLLLREQRQRERELRILQREEERRKTAEEGEAAGGKGSVSPVPAVKKTSRQQALESAKASTEPESAKVEESWFFDCLCGKHGTNYVRSLPVHNPQHGKHPRHLHSRVFAGLSKFGSNVCRTTGL